MPRSSDRLLDLLRINPWLTDVSCGAVWGADVAPFSTVAESMRQVGDPGLLDKFLESDSFATERLKAQSARRAEGIGKWNKWSREMRELQENACSADPAFDVLWRAVAKIRYDEHSGAPGPIAFGAHFSNVVMPADFELHGIEFDQFADFDNCVIGGKLVLHRVVFGAGSSWTRACFRRGSEVEGARFCDRSDFGAARWGGDSVFRDVQFSGPAMFRNAVFAGSVRFENVRFSSGAGFHIARFDRSLEFRGCAFSGAASFQQSSFAEPVALEDVTFDGPLHTDAGFRRRVESSVADLNTSPSSVERRSRRDGAA